MQNDNEISIDAARLHACGIVDLKSAIENLNRIKSRIGAEAYQGLIEKIIVVLRRTGDPDLALNHLERFVDALDSADALLEAVNANPRILEFLLVLFGASRFLSIHCISTAAESLKLLSNSAYLRRREEIGSIKDRLDAILNCVSKEEYFFSRLRKFRKQELMRIGLRDLLGFADLSETVSELSNLADACIDAACIWAGKNLRQRYGRPLVKFEDGGLKTAGFAVIGMGKLGGGELNFSSDVDLMYVYEADGETEGVPGPDGSFTGCITNHQYFIKMAEMVSAAIGRTTEDGFVFRVDLRLRPEGQRGPLAQSLGGYEVYYESWGQTWERSALIKARHVAGDDSVGREFISRITPFIYRKYLDFSAIVEIKEMKQKINREVQQKGKTFRDVKLGYGGIREVEFLVQALQLIYGGRDASLRERSTLRALHRLGQKGLLSYQEIAELSQAYIFLRMVEHRIQILNDIQTQTLPSSEVELRTLARRCGYLDAGREIQLLLHDYQKHTRRVRSIYDNLLTQPAGEEESAGESDVMVLIDPATTESDALPILSRAGFSDPSHAFRNIYLLREGQAFIHQTPRSRRVFNKLFPDLFREISGSPDPDRALNNLESYLSVQGSWDAFHALVQHNPKMIRDIVAVFSSSDYFSRILVRTPSVFEELLQTCTESAVGISVFLRRSISDAINRAETITDKLDALRRFKHREELRIGMADLAGNLSFAAASRGLSRLADACLSAALELAAADSAKHFGGTESLKGFAVFGVGKLGGRELIYGSDLDIMFVYDKSRSDLPQSQTVFEYFSKTAEKTIAYLTSMTREGAAYRVDTRLRPTGSKGPLVQSVDAVVDYYAEKADTWERQTLLNLRFVAGDRVTGASLISALSSRIFQTYDPVLLARDIASMRKRMEEEVGKEDDRQYNIKQGAGGLVDIEFLVQYLKLKFGNSHPRLRIPGTMNALGVLRREKLISDELYALLYSSYLFLRMLESRLRVVANISSSMLIRDPDKLTTLAKRIGFTNSDVTSGAALLAKVDRVKKDIRLIFDQVVHV